MAPQAPAGSRGADHMKRNVGVAWYRPWEWEKLRRVAADPEKLESIHAEWLRIAKIARWDLTA